MIELEVLTGPNAPRTFRLDGHVTFLLGRSRQAHLRLSDADDAVSRLHCLLEANGPVAKLVDLGSSNGTLVNGRPVTACELTGGETVCVGQTELRVRVTADPPTAAALPPVSEDLTAPTRPRWPVGPAPCPLCPTAPPELAAGPVHTLCPGCRAEVEGRPQPYPGYSLGRELGRGGFGAVAVGVRLTDGRPVAVKSLLAAGGADTVHARMFLRELDVQCRLEHPHVVRLIDRGGGSDGTLFAVMEYVPGVNAAAEVRRAGPFPLPRAVRAADHLLAALAHAHALGLIHRDVKPGNLLLQPAPGGEVGRLADFGLARVYQASRVSGLTLTGETRGTVPFMPPEQVTDFKRVTPAADQYSAAATVYFLLTGRYVYEFAAAAPGYAAIRTLLDGTLIPLRDRRPDVPAAVAAALERALARRPDERFPDVTAFRDELLRAAGDRT